MYNLDDWRQFLSKECKDYPEEDLAADSKFLSEQRLDPSLFNSLIEHYERENLHSFKQLFPSFALGNLLRLINVMRSHLHVGLPSNSAEIERISYCPPSKKLRFDQSPPNVEWFNKVKNFMLYFVREGEKENCPRRCVCAISPTIAVTFAHRRNKKFKARIADKGKLIEQGSILKLYSLYNDHDRREIKAEVVLISQVVDFILLEALDGTTFFEGDEKENILENPIIGIRLLAIGLSSDTPSQEAITTGVVLSTGPYDNDQMVSDIISWGGDSGGGLFSPSNKLLGIVSASQESNEGDWTRTFFAPSTKIRAAWEEWMVESGKKAKPQRLRRSEE